MKTIIIAILILTSLALAAIPATAGDRAEREDHETRLDDPQGFIDLLWWMRGGGWPWLDKLHDKIFFEPPDDGIDWDALDDDDGLGVC